MPVRRLATCSARWSGRGLGRVHCCFWLGVVASAACLHAASGFAAGVESTPVPTSLESPDVEYALPTRVDRIGRVLAPVMVNGQGPFRFILDTGANRSVLSPRVAELLDLVPSSEHPIGVHGVTGSALLPAVDIESLQAGDLMIVRNTRMPVLSGSLLAGADGILGIEGMAGSRIEIDFESGVVNVTSSRRAPTHEGMLRVPLTLRHRGLLVADARIGRVRIKAIIDTGAERTLGNMALFNALLPALSPQVAAAMVQGATPDVTAGASFLAPTIQVGDVQIENLEVTFGDLYVFRLWGLEQQPALLIGMDLIGTARRLIIDYRRREMQVLP